MKFLVILIISIFSSINITLAGECDLQFYYDIAEYTVYTMSACEKENIIKSHYEIDDKMIDCIDVTRKKLHTFNDICVDSNQMKQITLSNYSYCKLVRMLGRVKGKPPSNAPEEVLLAGSDIDVCGNYALKMSKKLLSIFIKSK